MNERYETLQRLHALRGEADFHLEVFGEQLAKRYGWRSLDGMQAIHYHLMQKHHWTPVQLREMTTDDLRLALHEELQDWTLPPEALA